MKKTKWPLTLDAIAALAIGNVTDQLVARYIVGCRVRSHKSRTSGRTLYDLIDPDGPNQEDYAERDGAWRAVRPYSRSREASWLLVQRMHDQLFSSRKKFLDNIQFYASTTVSYWSPGFHDRDRLVAWPDVLWFMTPLVICKASLKTMRGD